MMEAIWVISARKIPHSLNIKKNSSSKLISMALYTGAFVIVFFFPFSSKI